MEIGRYLWKPRLSSLLLQPNFLEVKKFRSFGDPKIYLIVLSETCNVQYTKHIASRSVILVFLIWKCI